MTTVRKFFHLLTRKEKGLFAFLLLIIILNSFFELLGLAVLIPIINLVAYPETTIQSSAPLLFFCRFLSIDPSDVKTVLVAFIVLVIALYFFKAAFYVFFQVLQNKIIRGFWHRLTVDLFSRYLYQPYEFHVYHNTAELISKTTYDVNVCVTGVSCALSILSDAFFCAVTFAYLVFSDWKATLIIFAALGSVSVFLNWLFKKKAREYGKAQAVLAMDSLKIAQEAFAGIKETKVSGTESFFIKAYDEKCNVSRRLTLKKEVIGTIPRTLVELVGITGILCCLLVYYLLGYSSDSIVGTFSLLAVSIVKLLPYISRISGQVNYFRGAFWSIERICNDVGVQNKDTILATTNDLPAEMPMAFTRSILLEDVSFAYQGSSTPVLLSASAEINKGEFVAFCGRSGAGKTTTIDLLLGLLKPQSGAITCDGINICTNLRSWRSNLAYVPQDIYLLDDTIRANVAFGLPQSKVEEERVLKALSDARLMDLIKDLPYGLDTRIGEKGVRLSGGQRQRIGIARALYRGTPIIVLDEATSALDFETEREILESINGLKGAKTVILITHRTGTISNCDKIYIVESGHIHRTK